MIYKLRKVSDVIDEIAMGPFGSNIKVDCFVPNGVPVLNGSNLSGFVLSEDRFNYVSPQKAASLNKAVASRGDVVITHRGTLGQIVYIPENSKYERYVISQSQFRVRCNPNNMLPEFMVYYFHSREGQHHLLSNSSQVGVPALARPSSTFQKLEMPVPLIEEQRKIVGVLTSLDARIAINRKINHHLEQIAQTIFKSWFIEFEPFGGLMPDNWRQGVLSDIAPTIYSGGTPSTGVVAYWNGNIPWLSSGETRNHFIIKTEKLITQKGVDNSSTRIARRHDIVMASAGQGFTRGQTSLLLLDTYVNQSVIVMSGQNPLYLFFNLSGRYDELRAISDSSSSRGSITTKMLAQLPMLIPSNAVISEFTTAILPLVNQIENNLCESTRLVELRDTLLPRLMSGELSVADVDAK